MIVLQGKGTLLVLSVCQSEKIPFWVILINANTCSLYLGPIPSIVNINGLILHSNNFYFCCYSSPFEQVFRRIFLNGVTVPQSLKHVLYKADVELLFLYRRCEFLPL